MVYILSTPLCVVFSMINEGVWVHVCSHVWIHGVFGLTYIFVSRFSHVAALKTLYDQLARSDSQNFLFFCLGV